jgi:hypothetical protein
VTGAWSGLRSTKAEARLPIFSFAPPTTINARAGRDGGCLHSVHYVDGKTLPALALWGNRDQITETGDYHLWRGFMMFKQNVFKAAFLSLALMGAAGIDCSYAHDRYPRYVVNPESPALDFGCLNLREGPGQYHEVVDRIPAGESVWLVGPCLEPDDDSSVHRWCNVLWRGESGWVSLGGLEYAE